MSDYRHIFLCTGTTCAGQGAEDTLQALRERLQQKNIKNTRLTLARCLGQCGSGPNMVIYGPNEPPEGAWYGRLVEEEVVSLIRQHLIEGKRLSHCLITPVDDV